MKWKLLAITAALALSGCDRNSTNPSGTPDQAVPVQDKICEVNNWRADATASCKPGEKIVFLPGSWGNEQLPILFAAVNCDMRYSVAMNNGGVVCIHAKLKPEQPAEASKPAQDSGSTPQAPAAAK